jgi:hypothetical protein
MPFDMYGDVILTRDVTEHGCVLAMSARSWNATWSPVWPRKAIRSSFST